MTDSNKRYLKSIYDASLIEAEKEFEKESEKYFFITDKEKNKQIICNCEKIMIHKIKKILCLTK